MVGPPRIEAASVPAGAIQPAYPRSNDVYVVTATIVDDAGFGAVSEVAMCWREARIRNACDAADPTHSFAMTWSPNSGFAVLGSNDYRDAGSTVGALSADGTTREFTFAFHVSHAMRASEHWAVEIGAKSTDESGVIRATTRDVGHDIPVNWFGRVIQARPVMDFGSAIEASDPAIGTGTIGTVVANGPAEILLTGSDWVHRNAVGDVDDVIGYGTQDGTLRLSARLGAEGGFVDMPTAGTPISLGRVFPTGTGEEPLADLTLTVRLAFNGGARFTGASYSGSLDITLVPATSR